MLWAPPKVKPGMSRWAASLPSEITSETVLPSAIGPTGKGGLTDS
jgi:hypothetical protein